MVCVWHRRAGKEKTFINPTAKRSAQRVGTYFYIFPTYKQAKKAIWDGMDRIRLQVPRPLPGRTTWSAGTRRS